jgi:hypothetical protein
MSLYGTEWGKRGYGLRFGDMMGGGGGGGVDVARNIKLIPT